MDPRLASGAQSSVRRRLLWWFAVCLPYPGVKPSQTAEFKVSNTMFARNEQPHAAAFRACCAHEAACARLGSIACSAQCMHRAAMARRTHGVAMLETASQTPPWLQKDSCRAPQAAAPITASISGSCLAARTRGALPRRGRVVFLLLLHWSKLTLGLSFKKLQGQQYAHTLRRAEQAQDR